MNKDFEDYVTKRCEKALMDNLNYSEKEMSGEVDQDTLQTLAEKICYKQGCKDTMAAILYSQEV